MIRERYIRIWFKICSTDNTWTDGGHVNISSRKPDVEAFRIAIQEKFGHYIVPSSAFVVYKNQSSLDSGSQLTPLFRLAAPNLGDSMKNALLVVLPPKKKLRLMLYRSMSSTVSCRKFLDSIAWRLSCFYNFYRNFQNPTIGDVLSAAAAERSAAAWSFRLAATDCTALGKQICRGYPLTKIPLPNIFTEDEWQTIQQLNYDTNKKIHDRTMPLTNVLYGKKYFIIPHGNFNETYIGIIKNITLKCDVFSDMDMLQVEDVEDLSEDVDD
jgi:hypothetical protein